MKTGEKRAGQFLVLALVSLLVAGTVLAGEARVQKLADEQRVKSGTSRDLTFDLAAIPAGQQVRLSVKMRVDWKDLAGYNPWMSVTVNGRALAATDLINKPVDFTNSNGVEYAWFKRGLWTVLYAPDFSDAVKSTALPWGFPDTDPYGFVWDITPYVRAGANMLTFHHAPLLAEGTTLVLTNLTVETGAPAVSVNRGPAAAEAPSGPLPVYVARGPRPVSMDVELAGGGAIRVTVGSRSCDIATSLSEPGGVFRPTGGGGWMTVKKGRSAAVRWSGTGYRVERKVTVCNDHIKVSDRIVNTSRRPRGVIYENVLNWPKDDAPKLLISGRPISAEEYSASEPSHPSVMALWPDLALGLLAEDDIFRVHIQLFRHGLTAGLRDPQLGLAPGKAITLEWSVYPVPGGDYWDVINAVRRNWGSNITIPGPGIFDGAADGSRDQAFYDRLVKDRGMKLVFLGQEDFKGDEKIKYPGYTVDLAEGTAIPMGKRWCASAAEYVRKVRRADPAAKVLVYVHPAICTEPGAEAKYADSRLLDEAGKHVTSPYHYPVYEYLAALDTSYGQAYLKTLDTILNEIKPDGIFMDEISGGTVPQYVYGDRWDGCTVTIDPRTHEITGKKASTLLLQQSWKAAFIKRLRERGKILVGNGPPFTRTMLDWRVPTFTELNSLSFLTNMHLTTPWGLGNHDVENSERGRAYMVRRALDYAAVVCGYAWGDEAGAFPYMRTMFPITPEELRPGMILGKERIVTNRSGRYGWADGADADVHVFDVNGRPVEKAAVKITENDGRRLIELRLRSDQFASLVRRTK